MADNSEEEKKELKPPRTRTRCQPVLSPRPAPPVRTHAHSHRHAHGAHTARPSAGPSACPPPHCLPLAPRAPPP